MQKGQKRGDGWNIAKDGSVNVQFKLNINNKEDRELLDMIQEWRQQGKMKAEMKKALATTVAIEQGYKEIVDANLLLDMNSKIDLLLSRPLPQALDGPKQLAVPKLAMPSFDDDDVMVVSKDTTTDAGANFFASMMSINQ